MDKKPQIHDSHYDALVKQITELVALSKQKALRAVNSALVEMNWNIGKYEAVISSVPNFPNSVWKIKLVTIA